MSVPFAQLYPVIRALVGDVDPNFPVYEDSQIAHHLTLLSWEFSTKWPLETTNPQAFQDLESRDMALIVLKTAIGLLSPVSNSFSYRTPIHSVTRSGGTRETLASLYERVAGLEAGNMFAFDGDIAALYQHGPDRLVGFPFLIVTG